MARHSHASASMSAGNWLKGVKGVVAGCTTDVPSHRLEVIAVRLATTPVASSRRFACGPLGFEVQRSERMSSEMAKVAALISTGLGVSVMCDTGKH